MNEAIGNINLKELSAAISLVCDEKGLAKEKVMEIVEESLAAAYKKDYGKKGQIIRSKFDPEKQTAAFFQIKEVVDETTRNMEEIPEEETENESEFREEREDETEKTPRFNKERDILLEEAKKTNSEIELGEELEIELETQNQFGRVAAQNAKQVIIQRLREAERENLYTEFKNKEGEVVTATVQRVENRNVFLDLGKMIGVLLPQEQVSQENYRAGQRIKVYVERVNKDLRDTTVVLSRSNPKLVAKLFSLEVPEIFSGAVEIFSIAREAGSRSKIAVRSKEEGVDPIGSCVGQKGIRVQSVIDELGGEKIDIIEYNEDPEIFISHALSPAKVKFVEIKEAEKTATVVVDPDQLSLAIGKRGQNVRLAARLTDWKVDIVNSEDVDLLEVENEEVATNPKATAEEIEKEVPAEEKPKKKAKKKTKGKKEEEKPKK
jgi:N utilization substance protein A